MASIQKRREQFKFEIRRKFYDDRIGNQRLTLLMDNIRDTKKQFQCSLDSKQKKQQWLNSILQKFNGLPSQQWRDTLHQLLWGISSFTDQIQLVLGSNLIEKLCSAFRHEFSQLKLFVSSGNVLKQLLPNNPQLQKLFIQKTIEFELHISILSLLHNSELQALDAIDLLIGIGNIYQNSLQIKNWFYKNGIVQLVWKIKQKHQSQYPVDLNEAILYFAKSMLYVKGLPQQKIQPKKMVQQFFNYFVKQLTIKRSPRCLKLIFGCFANMTSTHSKSYNLMFLEDDKIFQTIIKAINSSDQSIKTNALIVASNIIYNCDQIEEATLKLCCYYIGKIGKQTQQDKLEEVKSQQKFKDEEQNRYLCLNILCNIIFRSQPITVLIIKSSCFEIIEQSLKFDQISKVLKEAVSCIAGICVNCQYQTIQMMRKKIDIEDLFIQIIRKYSDTEHSMLVQILQALSSLLIKYNCLITVSGKNFVSMKLGSQQNFVELLNGFYDNHPSSKVRNIAGQVVDFLYQESYTDFD